MARADEILVETGRLSLVESEEARIQRLEVTLRKLALSALTMLGVGYVVVNAPIMILLGYFWSITPIVSQANVAAISGRIMFILASAISSALGIVLVFSGVKFYERTPIRGTAFLGLFLGSFYLLCLGAGSILMLQEVKTTSYLLLAAPLFAMIGAATYMVPNKRFQITGSILGLVGGGMLAYALLDVGVLELSFNWSFPITGPFLAFHALESIVVVLGPAVTLTHSILGLHEEEKPLKHLTVLLIALVYGVGVLIGSIVLSMSILDLIWKSPWIGPFNGLPCWVMNTIVFWSASLFLPGVGGVILIIASCLGMVFVAQEFSQF